MFSYSKVCKSSVFTLILACFLTQGCAIFLSSRIKPVPVAEADQHGISLDRVRSLNAGDRAGLVIAILGEPADRQRSCVLDGVAWRYPIRAWNGIANSREIVPAILLRQSFDESGTLTDWEFVDSQTERSMPVQETAKKAYSWFQSLSQAPSPIPPFIDLNKTLIRGQTTQQEVEQSLGQWRPDLNCGNGGPAPRVKKVIAESGSVWDWYVDRPSPLFIPPRYFIVAFDKHGFLFSYHFEATYPGGRN